MKYLENNKIKNEVIDKLIEEMENYKDNKVYACDLAYTLFEEYNIDGSITYNTYEAKEWIKNNFDDLGEIVEEIQANGLEVPNVFDSPEAFMVVIYLEVASYLMAQCKFIDEHWNDTIILNDVNISTITKQLKEMFENDKEPR